MIAYLKWEIIDISENKLVILTNSWIGYEVFINEKTFFELKENNQTEIFIYHHITETNQSLFGFLQKEEKQIFEELIKISGIWGKVAIQILNLWINNLSNAIASEDKKMIESIKWIGKKMAEKIILELKDKDFVQNIAFSSSDTKNKTNELKIEKTLKQDIISTLTNMGYSKSAIEIALTKIPEELETIEEILPVVIKELS